jgi:Zn-dependent protease with chaperone function
MTFWTFVALTPFVVLIYRAPSLLQMLAPALAIAVVIGVIGLLCGLNYTSSAQAKAAEDFGPSILPCDHWLSQRVGVLAERLSLPRPAVGAMTTCNAYAVGKDPDHAAVVLGQPLIQALASEELDAVIGHELGHIASGDMQKMQMAVGFQSVFKFIFNAVGEILATTLCRMVAQYSAVRWIANLPMPWVNCLRPSQMSPYPRAQIFSCVRFRATGSILRTPSAPLLPLPMRCNAH